MTKNTLGRLVSDGLGHIPVHKYAACCDALPNMFETDVHRIKERHSSVIQHPDDFILEALKDMHAVNRLLNSPPYSGLLCDMNRTIPVVPLG